MEASDAYLFPTLPNGSTPHAPTGGTPGRVVYGGNDGVETGVLGNAMLKVVVAPILLFALGFVPGLIMSAAASSWRIRAVTCVVLWSPVLVLLLLERFEAVEPARCPSCPGCCHGP